MVVGCRLPQRMWLTSWTGPNQISARLRGAVASRSANSAKQLSIVHSLSDSRRSAELSHSKGGGAADLVLGTFSLLAALACGAAVSRRRSRPRGQHPAHVARCAEAATTTVPPAPEIDGDDSEDSKISPFQQGKKDSQKQKLALNWDNVEMVLEEVRPYLRSDGGDCKIVEIDGPTVKLELQGACSSCSASSVTLKMGIEKTLRERIPEIKEVISVMPQQEKLDAEGVDEVLNGIRPFLQVSGGAIELKELPDGEESTRVVLKMTGPPLKSMAVRVEVVNGMKRKYPLLQDVEIVGEDGKPASA